MTKPLLKNTLVLLFSLLCLTQLAQAQYTAIADTSFENVLRTLGYDDGAINDGKVPTANINNITTLNVSNSGIKSLTGIKAFAKLTTLECKNNELTTLDVSNMASLTVIKCDSNDIASIQLGGCASLQMLYANNNQLTELSYPDSPYLYILYLANNLLTSIDISKLDYISTLDISGNNIAALDLRLKPYLTSFNCKNNPLLTCVRVTSVFYANSTFVKDVTTEFNTNCTPVSAYTAIPDSAFEHNLRLYGYDNSSVNDGKVPTNYIQDVNVTFLELSQKGIKDLTGIRDFIYLKSLNVSNNDISVLYLGQMKLSTLNATGNPNLQFVDCSNNELTYLGLSNVPSLEYLSVHNNKLTTLPLSSFGNVKLLDCSMNLLTKVFDGAMKKLIFLYCSGNQLSGKYVFDAPDGNVERKSNEARVSVLSTLKAFDCSNNKLTALDLNTLPGLENLNCSGNVLDSLNISVLASLDTLDASNNPTLSCIQVSDANAANAKLHYKKDNGTNYAVNCRITSLDENESISKQVLYPNPAITHINVDLYANAQVNIVNSIGELVYSKLFNKGTSELNVENLNAGLYFVEIKYADFSTVEKLVVRK